MYFTIDDNTFRELNRRKSSRMSKKIKILFLSLAFILLIYLLNKLDSVVFDTYHKNHSENNQNTEVISNPSEQHNLNHEVNTIIRKTDEQKKKDEDQKIMMERKHHE